MRGVRLLSLVLAAPPLLIVGAAEAADPPRREDSGLTFGGSLEVRYDDNILQLSPEDIDRLERNPDSSRFRISTPDDWVTLYGFDARWRHKYHRRETRVDAGVDREDYGTNDIKDWNEFHLGLYQELSASRHHLLALRTTAELMDDFYVRELTDDDASFAAGHLLRSSARFDQISLSVALSKEFIEDRLVTVFGWERARRDYVDDFDERDGVRSDWRLEVRGRPFGGSRVQLQLGGFFGDYAAQGDLASTPIPDDDVSYDHDVWSVKATLPWGGAEGGRLEAGFEHERRDYTTTNVFDLLRVGRHDERRDLELQLSQRVGRGLELTASWRHVSNAATFPLGVEPQDEITDFSENRYDIGLRARSGSQKQRSGSSAKVAAPRDRPVQGGSHDARYE